MASLDYRLRYSLVLAVLSGIRQEEILPPLPPEQATEHSRQVFNLFAVFNMVAINLVLIKRNNLWLNIIVLLLIAAKRQKNTKGS